MEKRFVVVKVMALNDQYECDADRDISLKLYSYDEVKKMDDYIEVFEIVGDLLKFRQDLSTYEEKYA